MIRKVQNKLRSHSEKTKIRPEEFISDCFKLEILRMSNMRFLFLCGEEDLCAR